jgi:hypothetical protein
MARRPDLTDQRQRHLAGRIHFIKPSEIILPIDRQLDSVAVP